MNLQQFVDQFDTMTCILSVEKKEDGSCGEIRIVTGNRAYIESIENPSPDMPRMMSAFSRKILTASFRITSVASVFGRISVRS